MPVARVRGGLGEGERKTSLSSGSQMAATAETEADLEPGFRPSLPRG